MSEISQWDAIVLLFIFRNVVLQRGALLDLNDKLNNIRESICRGPEILQEGGWTLLNIFVPKLV